MTEHCSEYLSKMPLGANGKNVEVNKDTGKITRIAFSSYDNNNGKEWWTLDQVQELFPEQFDVLLWNIQLDLTKDPVLIFKLTEMLDYYK